MKASNELEWLAASVAVELGDDWTIKQPTEDELHWRSVLVNKKGQSIHLSIEKGRVRVQTWSWPTYTTTYRGHIQTERVLPRELHPAESHDDITVAFDRGAVAVAKSIKSRFLPEYERIYALCAVKAEQSQAHYDREINGWLEVCKSNEQDPKHDSGFAKLANGRSVRFTRRGAKARVELDLDANQLAALVVLLNATNIEAD